ncbi:glycoside hydrolase family 43 protein [Lentinula lateritia]|uniref:Endo-1,5-alpha-L-arabinanase A n=1 Tax=Lentinula lateritia TaxID=40482 RepID=A0ABQ8VI37_9AGAR|nr:glycoside hydrolase family 43 protein [Lentinula lateritia]
MRPSLFLLSLSALSSVVKAVVGPGVVTGNTAVHDPTMCKDDKETYYVFSTGVGIEIRTSPDRTAWTLAGLVWPNGASWTDPYTGTTNGALWAPDCIYLDGQFYVSQVRFVMSAIFFAQSTTGLPGSFTNEGLVTSTSAGASYNAIDPNLLVVGSTWFLSLGSFWTGIKGQPFGSSTGKPTTKAVTALAQRFVNSDAIEASVIYQFGSFYYLFTSWDLCCQGTSSTYNIRVGRSTAYNGGYVDASGVALTNGGGTLVLGIHDSIVGPGGQDLMTDADGPILVYRKFLGINRLDFSSGWPVSSDVHKMRFVD